MMYLALVPLALSLAVYFVPVLLLHRRQYRRAQDFFVASTPTSPTVFQNASIAYQLQMATFGPFFLWGAMGDFLPAIVNSVFFSAGLFLIYLFRGPLFAFLDQALGADSSITIHEFIARQHGNDGRVRVAASLLTVFALFGLALGESIGLSALLKPFLPESLEATYALTFIILMLVFLYSTLAGNSGVMRSDQTHLGVAYVGLFATTVIILVSLIRRDSGVPSQSAFAIASLGAICLAILSYRKLSVLETAKISAGSPKHSFGWIARTFQFFETGINILIVIAAVVVVGVAAVCLSQIYSAMPSTLPVVFGTQFSSVGLLALALLPLFYGVVDITNWQRLAAIEKGSAGALSASGIRRAFFIYAIESPLLWLYMCMFGTVAAASFLHDDHKDIGTFLQQLVSGSSASVIAAMFLIASAFAMSLSTINSVFAGSLCAIRYDILPALRAFSSVGVAAETLQQQARRQAIAMGVIFYLAIVAALYFTERIGKVTFGSSQFLALLFAFYCAQLSFVPLILGPILRRRSSDYLTLTAPWALAVLACGLIAGLGPVGVYLLTDKEAWLWAAVPLCLVSGFLVFVVGRIVRPAVTRE